MREAIDRFDKLAAENGARIVHSCGFELHPARLSGCCCCTRRSRRTAAGELQDTTLVVRAMKGGPSGGTIASLQAPASTRKPARSPELARLLADPYALSPDRDAEPLSSACK